jgi:hypothetical protein
LNPTFHDTRPFSELLIVARTSRPACSILIIMPDRVQAAHTITADDESQVLKNEKLNEQGNPDV